MHVLIILRSSSLIYLGMIRLTNMGIAGFATGLYICYIQTCLFVYNMFVCLQIYLRVYKRVYVLPSMYK